MKKKSDLTADDTLKAILLILHAIIDTQNAILMTQHLILQVLHGGMEHEC